MKESQRQSLNPLRRIVLQLIGATVMPHNLYLHSGIVQNRMGLETPKNTVTFATLDSCIALLMAIVVNA